MPNVIFIAFVVFVLIGDSQSFEAKRLLEQPAIFHKELYEDPNFCHQMTWDLYWNETVSKPKSCRGGTCYWPFLKGPEMPDPISPGGSRICGLGKDESCIKLVIYDDLEKTMPTYVSRYCGVVKTTDGDNLSNRCRRSGSFEVCACRDANKCNGSASLKLGSVILLILPLVLLKLF